jgi:hypothetical protein
VHAQLLLHQAAREGGAVHSVDHVHHDGDAGKLAVQVGGGQELLRRLDGALLVLDGLGAQHQVRKVQLPGVRRRVRALGHVAQVAQVALVHHLGVVGLGHAVHFTVGRGVHQIEEIGKALAQAHAAAAAVADVEDPLHLGQGLALVVEIRVLPVDGMAGRCFEIAFTHGDVLVGGSSANKGHEAPCSEGVRPIGARKGPFQSTRASRAF